jgi:phenylalanyl-tRNA synthetase alpha chain
MSYQNPRIAEIARLLNKRFMDSGQSVDVTKSVELKSLYAEIPTLPIDQRAGFGQEVNAMRADLEKMVNQRISETENLKPIDITAPFDLNAKIDGRPRLLSCKSGSIHPLMAELKLHEEIFSRMGFVHMEAREIDDEYHMFSSLNFPAGHPARDDYDTFMTVETDKNGNPFIAPAHVSTMQNRLQQLYKDNLIQGKPIAVIYTGRTFRNEDIDARHEHTFYQVELSYIDRNIHAGMLIATIQSWLSNYYHKDIKVKTQPFYFPFTEPSFEFAASCIFCDGKGCNICSHSGWIELGGCGMIHPNVLKSGGIDPAVYSGFAGGFGLERLVMLKYGIEDIRHFESANLNFLRQF